MDLRPKFFQKTAPKFRKIVDVGCGPGTATISLLLWLKARDLPLPTEIHLLDQSKRALEAARELIASVAKVDVKAHRSQVRGFEKSAVTDDADLVFFSHVLNEMGSGPRFRDRKLGLLPYLSRPLKIGGHLCVVEPPLREPTLDIMWMRDQIAAGSDLKIRGPCPEAVKLCPMRKEALGWCYAQAPRTWAKAYSLLPWDRDLERLLSIKLSQPGMSYMLMQKSTLNPKPPPHGIAITDPRAREGLVCTNDDVKFGSTPFRGAYLDG